jgi:hypothetical protein
MKRGVELTKRKDFDEAWELLYKATRLPVADADSRLEALRAAIGLYKSGDRDQEFLNRANELLNTLQSMDIEDPRYPTLEKLRLQWTGQTSNDCKTATG